MKTIQEIMLTKAHEEKVTCVALSPDGRTALSGDYNGNVCYWDVDNGRALCRFKAGLCVNCLAFTTDGRHCLTGSEDETVWLWDLDKGEDIRQFEEEHYGAVHALAVMPDGKRFIALSRGMYLTVWDMRYDSVIARLRPKHHEMKNIEVAQDGVHAVTFWWKGFGVWDIDAGIEVAESEAAADAAVFSADGRWIRTLDKEGTFSLWRVRGMKLKRRTKRFMGPDSGKNEDLAPPDFDSSEEVFQQCLDHALKVKALAVGLSPGGRYAISTDTDGYARFWDRDKGNEVFRSEKHVLSQAVTMSADGHRAMAGGLFGDVHVWEMP